MVTARNSLSTLTAGVSTRADLLTYFNANLAIIDAAIAKCYHDAAAGPTVNDDAADGYVAGSVWFDITAHAIYICEDATTGAAVWRLIYPVSGAGDVIGPASATDGNIPLYDGITGKALKNSTYAPSSFALAAKGVTNGDSHDHAGGDGAAIVAAAFSFAATAKVLARKTAGAGAGEECSVTEVLDILGTAERGDILYRGSSAWSFLPHAALKGAMLASGGHGGDPVWAQSGWIPETAYTTAPASTSTLTMTADCTGYIKVGMGLKYKISGAYYYGVVTAITSNLLTIAGISLSDTVTELYFCDTSRVIQVDFFVTGRFADAANTTLLNSDMNTAFVWSLGKAYCVLIKHKVKTDDSGANQPRVSVSINGSVVGTDNSNAGQAVAETWTATVVGINSTYYDINTEEAIEIVTDANGTNDDASDLTVSAIFVLG